MIAVALAQVFLLEVEEVFDVDMLIDHIVAFPLADLAGLGVGVVQIAVLVEIDDGRILAVEDRPVAQGALVFELFEAVLLRHVLLDADDDRRLALLVASQHGEHHDEVAQFAVAAFDVLRLQLQRDLFFLVALGVLVLAYEPVDGLSQHPVVFVAVALGKLFHGVGVGHASVLVVPGELMLFRIVGPDAHLAGLDDQCQTAVQLLVGLSHATVLQPEANDIGDGHRQQQQGQDCQIPHPALCVRRLMIRIEPLVLQRRDLVVDVEV